MSGSYHESETVLLKEGTNIHLFLRWLLTSDEKKVDILMVFRLKSFFQHKNQFTITIQTGELDPLIPPRRRIPFSMR